VDSSGSTSRSSYPAPAPSCFSITRVSSESVTISDIVIGRRRCPPRNWRILSFVYAAAIREAGIGLRILPHLSCPHRDCFDSYLIQRSRTDTSYLLMLDGQYVFSAHHLPFRWSLLSSSPSAHRPGAFPVTGIWCQEILKSSIAPRTNLSLHSNSISVFCNSR